jgi:hypothetical protein
MVAYTGIQGQNILIVSSDPANPTEGQIWYNSTTNLLKGYANVVTNAWASGGDLNTARHVLGGSGTQTAALAFGGTTGSNSAATESYNGSAWTAGGNLGTSKKIYNRSWFTNSNFSIWWIYMVLQVILVLQNHIMELHGQQHQV